MPSYMLTLNTAVADTCAHLAHPHPTGGEAFTPASESPVARLSRGEIPAIVVRGALDASECTAVIRAFAAAGLYPPDFQLHVAEGTLPPGP
jgi:hypothetical protein